MPNYSDNISQEYRAAIIGYKINNLEKVKNYGDKIRKVLGLDTIYEGLKDIVHENFPLYSMWGSEKPEKFKNIAKRAGKWAWKNKGKIITGAAISGGLAFLASTGHDTQFGGGGVGYLVRGLGSVGGAAKELILNPILHPITHFLREGIVTYTESLYEPGVIKIYINDMLREIVKGDMLEVIGSYVKSSTIKNIPYYLTVGFGFPFGTSYINKKLRRRIKNESNYK